MANLQYMPGDPRLVDQLVYELKSKGIFDQFRKDCIADVDTRPAYQNLRQRVESSVSLFLSRQCWKPDLNKNQLREKLRKHILDGNYLEQGVERIVDQVVNPKVASVFIPQVEDLVYNYLGITRKKSTPVAETSNGKSENDLLPTDLEAVSPGSVKDEENKEEPMELSPENREDTKMEIDDIATPKKVEEVKEDSIIDLDSNKDKNEAQETQLSGISELTSHESDVSIDKSTIPLPAEDIKLETIPSPENSPPKIELEKIELPKEPNLSTDIPLPDEIPKDENFFKPVNTDDDSSSDSSLRRNMSPLTPIRNFNNENSCDAQQGFENDSEESKSGDKKEPSSFRFTIESKSSENSSDEIKADKINKKDAEQTALTYQFNSQVNINTFNTPLYEDSSNSNNLQIDYESDVNSKTNTETKLPEIDQNSEDTKKEQKTEEKKSSHKSSHRSRDSQRHSSRSKDRRSDSKHSSSRDRRDSKHDKKSSKDDIKSKSSHRERSRDRSEKKDSRDSSRHRSSHKSSHKDSKSHRSSSSSQRHSSKHSDEKKASTSSQKDKTEKSSKEKSSKDTKHSSHRSDKDKKSSSKKQDDREKDKKDKKDTDDHYSLSGRGNNSRRSTDRDSNDGSSSSKGSQNQSSSKTSDNKKDNKGSSKSDNTSTSSDSTSPSDKDQIIHDTDNETKITSQSKPIVRVETHLETPYSTPPRLPFVPDVTLKKPKFAANLQEAKRLMKMRKFLDDEQKRMNQEAALLLEFQANVRPSLSQVYSSIPGPELEFACIANNNEHTITNKQVILIEGTKIDCNTEAGTVEKNYDNLVINQNNNNSGLQIKECVEYITENCPENVYHNDIIQETDTINPVNQIVEEELQYNINETNENHIYYKEEISQEITNDKKYTMEVGEINSDSEISINNSINENELNEMINKTSRKEVMEIILGSVNESGENENVEVTFASPQEIDDDSNFANVKQIDTMPNEKVIRDVEENKKHTEYFEITIITEDVSENEDVDRDSTKNEIFEENTENCENIVSDNAKPEKLSIITENCKEIETPEQFFARLEQSDEDTTKNETLDVKTVNTEQFIVKNEETDIASIKNESAKEILEKTEQLINMLEKTDTDLNKITDELSELPENPLQFFAEHEKYNSELERDKFSDFLKDYIEKTCLSKMFLINCDTYEENIVKEASEKFGKYEIVNYYKNGHTKPNINNKIIKDLNVTTEITLPLNKTEDEKSQIDSAVFSPVKSECSFELSSDYDAKLEELVNKTSRKEVMEIILGGLTDESPSKMPKIDYCTDSNIETETEKGVKRKINEIDCTENNNRHVLIPHKIRKLSGSDLISSTTEEEAIEKSINTNNIVTNNTRSKYLGKARRVGLPKPRKQNHLSNSPSSDKSVENYEQNDQQDAPKTPNGKMKTVQRNKVQRYETTDLYKPKLHYLSRRNIT